MKNEKSSVDDGVSTELIDGALKKLLYRKSIKKLEIRNYHTNFSERSYSKFSGLDTQQCGVNLDLEVKEELDIKKVFDRIDNGDMWRMLGNTDERTLKISQSSYENTESYERVRQK